MKVGPKSSLRPFLHQALQLANPKLLPCQSLIFYMQPFRVPGWFRGDSGFYRHLYNTYVN